ncbi:MAG: biotin--[acetyl-CoA-carboxylase] ligase [Desulfobacterales bacterium]|nr:biotin--[acetyl-CoA-carboxylase] ligase [Desulfobacterales bacterium]
MKGKILNILRANANVISGEAISDQLGISRVAVWKHIQKLRELHYKIASTPGGYRLENTPDALHPWEFPGREPNIHYFPEVASTMNIARNLAREGCPEFTVVIADRQTKGRGRLARTWLSGDGGLYFTLVLRPKIPPVLSARVTFAASLTLARTLQDRFRVDARVKWPNDILVNEKKLSGMLSEMEAEGDAVTFVNIGLGVNVNNDPTAEEPGAISLKRLLGKEVSRRDLLSDFLDRFQRRLTDADLDDVIPEWKKYTITLNRPVKVATIRDTSEGTAVDVDENGALILKLSDGSLKKITHGDCFHAPEGRGGAVNG